jgi:hypothetical protein
MSSGATKSVAGASAPRPIAVEWASWPLRVKSGEDLGRRVLNGSEGRQQRLFVAGIELNVVARRRACVETDRVSVPVSAPLPEAFARVACLCSGRRADVRQGRIAYEGVPRDIGAVLLTALGQPRAIVANVIGAQEG